MPKTKARTIGHTGQIEPAAIALLDRAIAAHKAPNGVRLELATEALEPKGQDGSTSTIQWKPANLLRLDVAGKERTSRMVCNGKEIFTSYDGKTYQRLPMTIEELPPGLVVGWTAMAGGAARELLPFLLNGQNFLRDQVPGTTGSIGYRLQARRLPRTRIEGVECNGLRQTLHLLNSFQKVSFETTAWFDAQTNLLRRVQRITNDGPNRTVYVDKVLTTDFSPDFAPETFIWSPPPGATQGNGPALLWDPKLVVGSTPPALSGRDLNGNAVSLDKYKGKVVLLDFWATWCGPCLQELPNVVRNYRKYHAKGFEVIGISFDKDRKALTECISALPMPWPQLFDGKSFKAANAVRYKVRGIPFTLLIGKDGKIAAVTPIGVSLEESIKAALAR